MKRNRRQKSASPKNEPFLEAKKSLGQNFLTSNVVPSWMANAADITKGAIILEIGPGTGVLTKELLSRGAVVYAIETDRRAILILEELFVTEIKEGRLHIIEGDIRTYELGTLPLQAGAYKVVANIPYYLSGFLLRTLLEHPQFPKTLVFLMQKELVSRIARTKKESLLSLGVKAFGTPYYFKTVTRGHFQPQPRVDSAILQVTNISHALFQNESDRQRFFSILHLGFGKKRKQLQSNLQSYFNKTSIERAFNKAELPLNSRAEDLPLEKWLILMKELPF